MTSITQKTILIIGYHSFCYCIYCMGLNLLLYPNGYPGYPGHANGGNALYNCRPINAGLVRA
jgi:hypothetical protein